MNTILNFHVLDQTNIGDCLSSPLQYFEFPGFTTQTVDIREIDPLQIPNSHIIIGGGGLLYQRFRGCFEQLVSIVKENKNSQLIAWGVGQQSYDFNSVEVRKNFDYLSYLQGFDLVGIRDVGYSLPWLPCVSCMHPTFDRPRKIKHDMVVFSHKKFQINIPGLPTLKNSSQNFEQVIDFLASGETILTSSYHGAYWGTLLGRKVLAFPFSTKFYTLKHLPVLYPTQHWKQARWKISLFNKQLYQHRYKNKFVCDLQNWKDLLKNCQVYPESLAECRRQNQAFYQQCLERFAAFS
ncbi:MAG: hypothetical protein RLZZ435_2764 [Cyanobacteriota bacterium]|jgi:hypothetical protein